jgi:signal transduction histidine kinase/CheY-like chemotaxis protein
MTARRFALPAGPAAALTAFFLLIVFGVGVMIANGAAYREQQVLRVNTQAAVLAESVSAPLAFADTALIEQYVAALSADPNIETAAIYDAGGVRAASFTRGAAPPALTVSDMMERPKAGDAIEVWKTIGESGSTPVGSVFLRVQSEPVASRLARYGAIAIFACLAGIAMGAVQVWRKRVERTNKELEARAEQLAEANNRLQEEIIRRQDAQRALARSQKMEAIGQLTGGLAHDFNNLLAVVSGGIALLQKAQDVDRRSRIIKGMEEAVDKGAKLTRQLLIFARGGGLQRTIFSPAERLLAMRELLQQSLREDILLKFDLADDLWHVDADPDQFALALVNMAVNARDATPGSGMLTIEARNVVRTTEPAGEFVRISVTDTGAGMEPETLERAFEPFFTTKEVGKGTGLGLPQIYGFARQSSGAVDLRSQPGAGTTVLLDLPRGRVRQGSGAEADSAPAGRAAFKPGRVLLVEDDEAVADMVCQLIESGGHSCKRVADGRTALAELERGQFDLVFSDIVMPGPLDGVELAREIRRRWPTLPVVLTTGYSGRATVAPGEFQILVKPCEPAEMLAALGAAMNASGREAVR